MSRYFQEMKQAFFSSRNYRRKFLLYLIISLVPFLTIALTMNVYYLRTHLSDTTEILRSVSAQAGNQLATLCKMSNNLARNISINPILQEDVLSTVHSDNDYQVINQNIIKLRSIIRTYPFLSEIAGIRFFLPSNMIVADGKELFAMETVEQETWYAQGVLRDNMGRWYAAEGGAEPHTLIFAYPLQNPNDYTDTVGYLLVDVARENAEGILSSSLALEGMDSFLLDHEGRMILHEGVLEMDFLRSFDELHTLLGGDAAAQWIRIGGSPYLALSNPVEASSMTLVSLVPQAVLVHKILLNCVMQVLLLLLEIAFVMGITWLFTYTRIRNKNDQLKLLNYQINPHFLYNTLDTINWQAINLKRPDIYRPIQALSRFYKIMLNHGSDLIKVSDEVELLRLYCELQNMRFDGSISYRFEMEPEILECTMLHMVLQPVLENAILHGIQERNDRSGHIEITGRREGKDMLFTVTDTGVGMEAHVVKQLLLKNAGLGYGLNNIQQRIQLFYGKHYGMRIESTPDQGTTVRILLPVEQ